jgi:tetratricopeptide (TPR) repeat protein
MCRKALETGANEYRIWGNLADAYRLSGEGAKAKEAYEQGVRLIEQQLGPASDNLQLRTRLALYLASGKQKERALKEIERCKVLPKPDPQSLFFLGVASELAGRRDAALSFLGQSVRAGYSAREIQIYPDLVALRADPGYHRLLLDKTKSGKAGSFIENSGNIMSSGPHAPACWVNRPQALSLTSAGDGPPLLGTMAFDGFAFNTSGTGWSLKVVVRVTTQDSAVPRIFRTPISLHVPRPLPPGVAGTEFDEDVDSTGG